MPSFKKILEGLSKQHSKCPQVFFSWNFFFWKNSRFLISLGQRPKKIRHFFRKRFDGVVKPLSTCPSSISFWNILPENLIFFKFFGHWQNFFRLLLRFYDGVVETSFHVSVGTFCVRGLSKLPSSSAGNIWRKTFNAEKNGLFNQFRARTESLLVFQKTHSNRVVKTSLCMSVETFQS